MFKDKWSLNYSLIIIQLVIAYAHGFYYKHHKKVLMTKFYFNKHKWDTWNSNFASMPRNIQKDVIEWERIWWSLEKDNEGEWHHLKVIFEEIDLTPKALVIRKDNVIHKQGYQRSARGTQTS